MAEQNNKILYSIIGGQFLILTTVIGFGLSAMNTKIESVSNIQQGRGERISKLEGQYQNIDSRFDRIEQQLNEISKQLRELKR